MNRILTAILILITGFSVLRAVESEKNPYKAMVFSTIVPGGGQIYTKEYIKAALILGVQTYFITQAIIDDSDKDKYQAKIDGSNSSLDVYNVQQRNKYRDEQRSDYWWIGTTVFLSVADAFVDAHLYNFKKEKAKVHLKFEDKMLQLEYKF